MQRIKTWRRGGLEVRISEINLAKIYIIFQVNFGQGT